MEGARQADGRFRRSDIGHLSQLFTAIGAGVVVGVIVGLLTELAADPPSFVTGGLAGILGAVVAVFVTSRRVRSAHTRQTAARYSPYATASRSSIRSSLVKRQIPM